MFSRKEFVEADKGASPTQWIVALALVLVLVSGGFLGIAAGLFEESRATQHMIRTSEEPVATSSSTSVTEEDPAQTEEIAPGAKFLSVTGD